MLRSHKLTGSLYIGIGLLSTVVGIIRNHDPLAGVGVVFFCIGTAILASETSRANKSVPPPDAGDAHRHPPAASTGTRDG